MLTIYEISVDDIEAMNDEGISVNSMTAAVDHIANKVTAAIKADEWGEYEPVEDPEIVQPYIEEALRIGFILGKSVN